MAAAPSVRCNDTQRDRMPIWMWDDETPKPIGAIDHDGWSYIYYGPHIDYQADFNLMAFNFAQAANNFVANAVAADNAPTQHALKFSFHGNYLFQCSCTNSIVHLVYLTSTRS